MKSWRPKYIEWADPHWSSANGWYVTDELEWPGMARIGRFDPFASEAEAQAWCDEQNAEPIIAEGKQ